MSFILSQECGEISVMNSIAIAVDEFYCKKSLIEHLIKLKVGLVEGQHSNFLQFFLQ